MPVDPALVSALGLDPETATIHAHGGSGFASSFKVSGHPLLSDAATPLVDYFVKTDAGPDAETMFRGEHASLNAIAGCMPGFCPRAHAHGPLQDRPGTYFLATDFIDLDGWRTAQSPAVSFAARLAELHSREVSPAQTGSPPDRPFGFPVPTCCGNTVQDNAWTASWSDFYADRRLRHVHRVGVGKHGPDAELARLVERTATVVVPRLLGDGHLRRSDARGGGPIRPVAVHGDLWSGNQGTGRIPSDNQEPKEPKETLPIVYDPACVYGHAEYDLGIMRMFGGFGSAFWDEYTSLVPPDEPASEWDDRLALYELYHHLNHYSIFGRSYRGGAVHIMERLLGRYEVGCQIEVI